MPQNNKNKDWKNKLNEHPLDEKVWEAIDAALDFENQLANRIPQLPDYEPDRNLWERISADLPNEKILKRRIIPYFHIAAVAASIALLFFLSKSVFFNQPENIRMEAEWIPSATQEINIENIAIAQLKSYCHANTQICEKPEFRELMKFYEELNVEESELKKAMNTLGDSPEMIKALIKIENLKSETIQDLIVQIQ